MLEAIQKLCGCCPASNSDSEEQGKTSTSSKWMSQLSETTKLVHLCLPGTHNSHAYSTSFAVPCAWSWILCQKNTVYRQLVQGVRLIDLRYKSSSKFGHGPAFTSSAMEVARDVVEFCSAHPTEVVVCLARGNFEIEEEQKEDDSQGAGVVAKSRSTSISRKLNVNGAQLFAQALKKAIQKSPSQSSPRNSLIESGESRENHNSTKATSFPQRDKDPQVYEINDLHTCNAYRYQTLVELTEGGTRGAILVDTWDHWQGSWNFTKDNRPHHVMKKCREWSLQVPKRRIDDDNGDGEMNDTNDSQYSEDIQLTNMNNMRPRLLEFVITIDYGPFLTTLRLAVFSSIRTVAKLLENKSQRENFWGPSNDNAANGNRESDALSIVLSHVDAIFSDYPTQEFLNKIISHNYIANAQSANIVK